MYLCRYMRAIRFVSLFVLLVCWCFTTQAQVLTFQSLVSDDSQGGSGNGMDALYGVVVSPDNKHVYTASSTDDAVSVFVRDSAGNLTYSTAYLSTSPIGGTIPGLDGAKRLAISSDGKHLYVPTSVDDALCVFSRDTASGALTYLETHWDSSSTINGLDGAFAATLSPNGLHVYVTGTDDNAVTVFLRNPTTGSLTYIETLIDNTNGVNGIMLPRGLGMSPDGAHLYVAGTGDDAMAVFSRNATTGQLTFVEAIFDNQNGVDGLDGIYDCSVSPDNQHIYTAAATDEAVTAFVRNTTTGTATWIETHKDNSLGGSVANLDAARSVHPTLNGLYVLAAASTSDAIEVFSRDPATGKLNNVESFVNNTGGVSGLDGVRFIAESPNTESIYSVSVTDDALVAWTGPGGGPIPCTSIAVLDTITTMDTLQVLDSVTVTINDTLLTLDTLQVIDSVNVLVYDTLLTLDTLQVMDTLNVLIYDTLFSYDTLQVLDTTNVLLVDTITTYDTTTVVQVINDTLLFLDTIPILDTALVLLYDTLTVLDSITVVDTITVAIPDTVTVTVYDTIAVMDTLIIQVNLTGLPAPNNLNTLRLYPNPANDVVHLHCGNLGLMINYSVNIINAQGQQVYQSVMNMQVLSIPVTQLGSAGLYFVQIHDSSGNLVEVAKLVLQ